MSQLVDLYNKSQKPRVVEARQIPHEATHFFDREGHVNKGFVTGEKQGDPTAFSQAALNEYDTEVKNLTPPPSFDPQQPLHRYTPETPFFNPGQPKS
jgi:hypothetical protein